MLHLFHLCVLHDNDDLTHLVACASHMAFGSYGKSCWFVFVLGRRQKTFGSALAVCMRNSLGWLETRLAQYTLNYVNVNKTRRTSYKGSRCLFVVFCLCFMCVCVCFVVAIC